MERERFGGKKFGRASVTCSEAGEGCFLLEHGHHIHDSNGMPCVSTSAQHACWRQHFTKVLNVVTVYDRNVLELVRQHEEDDSLAGRCTQCT